MKHLFAFFALLGIFLSPILLIGCAKEPAQTTGTNNSAFQVDELFTHKGCTVYRFYDSGHYHYFTNCHGSVSSTLTCGKNCTRPDEVPTNFSVHY